MSEEYKRIISIVIPYSLLCAFLNLYYYWKPFGVQPFEFISFSESLSYTVPFIMLSAFMLIPVFIIELTSPSNYIKFSKDMVADGSSFKLLVGITIAINFIMIFLAESEVQLGIPILMGIVGAILPGALQLSYSPNLIKFIPSKVSRVFLCLILACLPVASIMQALIARSSVINQDNYRYIIGADIKGNLEKCNLIYIGHLNNSIFLRRVGENTTIIYPLSSLKRLELRKSENKT